jgi:UDP-2-acetamido-3-amino-2,3-dideoxy-glucuronate N-acetyltransferase
MKIAVVGCGYWGRNLVRNFYKLGVLAAICDSDTTGLKALRESYPDVFTTESVDDILNNSEIKGVAIATPSATHFQLAKKALLRGKDVFVEKPLALNVNEGEELVQLAERKHATLMVDHILQYHPAITKLKEIVRRGELGELRYVYSNRLNIGRIRREENILWSFAPHDISLILSIVGEMPENVVARGAVYLQRNVEDVTLTFMKFPSGTNAHIFVSWLNPFKEQKLVVVGSSKMAVFDDVSDEKLVIFPHRIEWDGNSPVASKAEREIVHSEEKEPLAESCRHFIDCIKKKRPPLTDGKEGVYPQIILHR